MDEREIERLAMLVNIDRVNIKPQEQGIEVTITLKTSLTLAALELTKRVGQTAKIEVTLLQRPLPLGE